jgi:osmotically-inducible protein OsmY
VTLLGIVVDENESQACERVVAKVAGVVKVANALKVMKDQEMFRQYGEVE